MAVFLLHHLLSLIYCVTFVSSMRRGFGQTYDQTYDQTHDQTYDQISDQTSDQGHILSPIHDQPEQENNILDDNFGSTRTNVGGRSVSRRGAKKAAGSSRQNHGEGYGNEASHGGTTYEHLGQGLHGLYPGYQSPFPETLKLIQASLNNQTQRAGHGLGAPGTNQYRLRHQRQRGLPKPQVVNSGGCRGRGKCTIM
uniref:Secreted protein n=1 Tax=Meloidogyne hapla TaxID=6305 RepID=A0A1I8BFE6_MELHA